MQILKDGPVVVEDGLKKNEEIVSDGVHKLQEGMRVKVLPTTTKTNIGGLL